MKTLKISVLAIMLTSFAIAQEKKAANVDVEETETVTTSYVKKDGKVMKEEVKTKVKKEKGWKDIFKIVEEAQRRIKRNKV